MSTPRLRIERPRVLWAERSDPDAVSNGDEACLSFAPDLLRFLDADLGDGLTPGAGLASRFVLPLTAAASASYYVASPRGRESMNAWRATRVHLAWTRSVAPRETVEARARIVRMGRASIHFHWRVASAEDHGLIAEGDLVVVSRDGRAAVPPVRHLHQLPARPAITSPSAAETWWQRGRGAVRALSGRLRTRAAAPEADARTARPDPAGPLVFYVRGGVCDGTGACAMANTASDLVEPLRALLPGHCCDDPFADPGDGGLPSVRNAAFEARLARCGGPGVHIILGPRDDGPADLHFRSVAALHPAVRIASATDAALAYLGCHSPRAIAVALPPSHCRGDGMVARHPVRILGGGADAGPLRLAVSWCAPGEVREASLWRDGAMLARHRPERGEAAAVEFVADRGAGYELVVERSSPLSSMPAPRAVEAGRFVEWPGEPVVTLAAFEAPFQVDASRASPDGVAAGDWWTWIYPAGLLRLLYNPIAGGSEPLGRRAHPLGAIAAAAAVHVAGEVLGAHWTPQGLTMRYRRSVDPDLGIVVRACAFRAEPREIELRCRLEQPPSARADVFLTLRYTGA